MQIFQHSDVMIVIRRKAARSLKWAKVIQSIVKKSFGKRIYWALVYFVSCGDRPTNYPMERNKQVMINSPCKYYTQSKTIRTVDSRIFSHFASTAQWQTTIEISFYNFCKSKILKYLSSNLPYIFFRPPSSKMVYYIV